MSNNKIITCNGKELMVEIIRFDFQDENELEMFKCEFVANELIDECYKHIITKRDGFYSVKLIIPKDDVERIRNDVVSRYKTAKEVDMDVWDY